MACTGAVLALVLGASACGGSDTPPAEVSQPAVAVSPPSLRSGQPVPAPTGKVALTMTGRITQHNHRDALQWDVATINGVGLSRATVYDPWDKRSLDLRGVWLADLLEVAQAGPDAGVQMTALDDYKVRLTAQEIAAGGIMLATQTGDGKPIPVEEGGPTRIVFVGGVASGKNPDQWIWSLKTLEVT